jgi:hypothetical protein
MRLREIFRDVFVPLPYRPRFSEAIVLIRKRWLVACQVQYWTTDALGTPTKEDLSYLYAMFMAAFVILPSVAVLRAMWSGLDLIVAASIKGFLVASALWFIQALVLWLRCTVAHIRKVSVTQ